MSAGRKIVFVGGVWDLFHVGHLNILKKAKSLGDVLIVGVSTDALVYQYKKVYPVISQADRLAIISELKCVSWAVFQNELASVSLMQKLNVDIFVSGEDWKDWKTWPKEKVPEGYSWIDENLEMVFLPRTSGISSTSIKKDLNCRDKI